MIAIIWRGIGILVPLILVAAGGIFSIWHSDTRVGNFAYTQWVFLSAAIALLPIGLATWKPTRSESEPDENGVVHVRIRKHDFFYIPILIWSLIFGGISVYMFTSAKKGSTSSASDTTAETSSPAETYSRNINFHNPTGEPLRYFVGGENKLYKERELAEWSNDLMSFPEKSVFIGATSLDGETALLTLPTGDIALDKTKSVVSKNTKYSHRRNLPDPTPDEDDYDDIWVMLDESYGMNVIDITEAYANTGKIKNIDWKSYIVKTFPAGDIMPVVVKPGKGFTAVKVVAPNTLVPEERPEELQVFILLPFGSPEESTNTYIASEILRLMKLD